MPLHDSINRCIDYLRVSITDRCKLSCVYCKPRERLQMLPHREILRYEEILRLVSVAVDLGIVHVRITGGEPLVRRGVLDFIAELKKKKGLRDISLTTNGVLLDELAQGLRDAGISRINISLDSLDARKFSEITGSDSVVHAETAYDLHATAGARSAGHGILGAITQQREEPRP